MNGGSFATETFEVSAGSDYTREGPAIDLWYDDYRVVTEL